MRTNVGKPAIKKEQTGARSLRSRPAIVALIVALGGCVVPAHAAAILVPCTENDLVNDINLGVDLSLTANCTYTLTVDHPAGSGNGLPVINKKLTIDGQYAIITRDPAAPQFRILEVAKGGDLTLNNVTVKFGNATRGGGIYNLGTLTVRGSTLSNNHADVGGGAVANGDAQEAPNPGSGTLTLSDNSVVSDNSAGLDGGGIANGFTSTMKLSGCIISGNKGGFNSGGGGIASQGKVFLDHCKVSGNTAVDGGGIISTGQLMLVDTPVTGNGSTDAGGSGGGGILNQAAGGTATLIRSNVSNNSSASLAGGIGNVGTMMVIDSTVSGNIAIIDGGGIANGGTMTLIHSPVKTNIARNDGGGIANVFGAASIRLDDSPVTGNNALDGGGIFNGPQSGNTVTLRNSPVTNNTPNDCSGVQGC